MKSNALKRLFSYLRPYRGPFAPALTTVRDLWRDIDEKMRRMKLGYYDTRTNGEILSVVTNDVDAVNTLLGKNFYTVVTSAITLVGVLAMLLTINVWIVLIAVAMIPATLLVSGPVMKAGAKNFAARQDLLGAVNGYIEEIYGGKYAELYNSQFG